MESRGRNNRNCAADLCLVRIFVLPEKNAGGGRVLWIVKAEKNNYTIVLIVFDQTKKPKPLKWRLI